MSALNSEQIIELAHKHNALVIQQGVASATEEWLTTFATAVIAAHTEDLLKNVGEPVAWATREADGSVYDCICHEEHDMFKRTHTLSLYTSAQVAAAVASKDNRIAELESRCDETYVASGADAYDHACSEMERWQEQRLQAGKEVGTQGSLCDGMAWLYERINTLESALKVAQDGLASIHTATAGSYSNIQEVLHAD